jgi:hypothetical protein
MRIPLTSPAALLLALAALAPGTLAAQAVRGQLSDEETSAPIADAALRLIAPDNSVAATARTDSLGEFLLPFAGAAGGTYRIRAEKLGYRPAISTPLTLEESDTLDVHVRLARQVVLLDSITVTAPEVRRRATLVRGFYDRLEQRAFGYFVTREDIAARRPTVTTDLLSTVPGVRTIPRRLGDGAAVVIRGTCTPTLYIDGVKATPTFGMTIDDLVRPVEIEGMEIYRSIAEAPPQYQGLNAGCSAILVWTRVGR